MSMSSTSSLCSSDADILLDRGSNMGGIRSSLERFSICVGRLRLALDVDSTPDDGDSMCVSVHEALEAMNESMRQLFRYEEFKTNAVILPSLQLVQAVKELKFDASVKVDVSRPVDVLDNLESAVCSTLIREQMTMIPRSAISARHSLVSSRLSEVSSWTSSPSASLSISAVSSSHTLSPLRPAMRAPSCPLSSADAVLLHRPDGVEIAFERAKTSSRYCKELSNFVKSRLAVEAEHAKKVCSIVEQCRFALDDSFRNVPLLSVFESGFDCENDFATTVKETIEHLNDRFLKTLEARRSEHDNTSRMLKNDWNKHLKALADAESEQKRAEQTLTGRQDALRKLRREERKKDKDPEKKKRSDDEAVLKVEEAQKNLVASLADVRDKRQSLQKLKEKIIEKLRELIFQCDQTTKACASHYFKALSSLWMGLPHRLAELAERVREYEPGAAYMNFIQSLPSSAAYSASAPSASSAPPGRTPSEDLVGSPCATTSSSSKAASDAASPSSSSQRRNAINPEDAEALPDLRRHKKGSAGRGWHLSSAAASHSVQRSVQPGRCCHCDKFSVIQSVYYCSSCNSLYHKRCFPLVTMTCGQQAARKLTSSSSDRRMSVFGVSLDGQLRNGEAAVPALLQLCVDEIHSRGMRVKGIYRTSGVKSKVEEICAEIERSFGHGAFPSGSLSAPLSAPAAIPSTSSSSIDLSSVHPINLACVVKLFLHKLPSPLLTFQLYSQWTRVADLPDEDSRVAEVSRLLSLLPPANHATLQLLALHLHRLSCFSQCNLMCPSNLSTVIAPSLLWSSHPHPPLADTHALNAAVSLIIKHAFTLFDVDREVDFATFAARFGESVPVGGRESEEDDGETTGGEEIVEKERRVKSEYEDDEEDDDEEEEEEEEDEIFLQPSTPDLLKTSRSVDMAGASSSVEDSSSPLVPRRLTASSASSAASGAAMRQRLDKRRSYTTSILITPSSSSTASLSLLPPSSAHSFCSPVHPRLGSIGKQKSVDEAVVTGVRSRPYKECLPRSARDHPLPHPPLLRCSAGSGGLPASPSSSPPSSLPSSTANPILSIRNVGDLFAGSDVSYV